MHAPLFLKNITLEFPGKICFTDFSAGIQPSRRIFIIGNNGSGKTALLKIIQGLLEPTTGIVENKQKVSFGYVPQLITDFADLSGAGRFNKALSGELAKHPDLLLLDEPTNHLDALNRRSLQKMLDSYAGTLVIVSHDEEFLQSFADTLWHINNAKVSVFRGRYADYQNALQAKRQSIGEQIFRLKKEQKENQKALLREQQRAKKSRAYGKKMVREKRWLPALADQKKSCAERSAGQKQKAIAEKRTTLRGQLADLYLPKIIRPVFSLSAQDIGRRSILSISRASAGYAGRIVLSNINLVLGGGERLAVTGDNGAGKTTLFRAILDLPEIVKSGDWDAPRAADIGYLDQHYAMLDKERTVYDTLAVLRPDLPPRAIRSLLSVFLFRANEEVEKKVSVLSGGEKARLSLAKIAVKTPRLLLLDEATNNIDLETKDQLAAVLREYPGALLIISHDRSFLENIGVERWHQIVEPAIGFEPTTR
ncbi:MAG: ATP-binding cassette domain-containing protein [Candidatus Margulisbacteria bacterium]|nr:ATP-binding cassette domain-containing protein [Candidatus Margulisiibacteriota bacterium]